MEVKHIVRKAGKNIDRHSPEILTGTGIVGVISTAVLAHRAANIALLMVEQERCDRIFDTNDPREIIKIAWKAYVPVFISGTLTIGSILLAHKIHTDRMAAMTGLYTVANTALHDYQDKVASLLGEKKDRQVRESVIQDKLDKNPVETSEVFITGLGDYLCFDDWSGRYFKSDIETIRRCMNDFNKDIWHDSYRTLNEFYDMIGLEDIDSGRNMGWDVDNGLLDIRFTAKIATNGEPCIVLEYIVQPKFL